MRLRSRPTKKLHGLLGKDDMTMPACQLVAAVHTHGRYQEMGIPDEIYSSSMKCFTRFLNGFFPQCRDYRFVCHSWLLSPELRKLLDPGSNILNFQDRFFYPSVRTGR